MTTTPYSEDTFSHPRLDVSHLKTWAMDTHAPAWWGNLLLMFIETTTIVLMLATYLYLRQDFDQWPPPRTDMNPVILKPYPNLPSATITLALLLATCLPMYITDQFARSLRRLPTIIGLAFMFLTALASLYLHYLNFRGLHFRWDDNAYSSTMWWILSLHVTYVLAAAGEFFIMGSWLLTHDFDHKHALDVTLAGLFWYWVAGVWTVIYFVTYLGLHLF